MAATRAAGMQLGKLHSSIDFITILTIWLFFGSYLFDTRDVVLC